MVSPSAWSDRNFYRDRDLSQPVLYTKTSQNETSQDKGSLRHSICKETKDGLQTSLNILTYVNGSNAALSSVPQWVN